MGTRDALAPNKLVFGISVGDKIVLWLRLRARGTAGHGSQPIPDNANMTLLKAIEKALALPEPAKQNPVVEEMKRAIGVPLVVNKLTSAYKRNQISLKKITSCVGSIPNPHSIPSTPHTTTD